MTQLSSRIRPKTWWGWVIGVVYAPIFISVMIASGVEYDEFTESAASLRDGAVVPLAVMAVLVLIVITALGWWRPVLRDDLGAPRIWRWIPVVFVVAIVAATDFSRISKLDTQFIVWAAVASVLVGFAEEGAYRGLAVVSFRSSYSEMHVWLFSTLLFMLLHAWNFLAGQDLAPTVFQLVFTFVLGTFLYAVRRVTGSLIIPMILHGAWDFASFTSASDAFKASEELVDPRQNPVPVILLLVMVVLFAKGFKNAFRSDDTTAALAVA